MCIQSVTLSIAFKWSHTGTVYMKCSQDAQDMALSGKRNFVIFFVNKKLITMKITKSWTVHVHERLWGS